MNASRHITRPQNKLLLSLYFVKHILNQVFASRWLARAWSLKIVSVQTSVCVCVCVCVRARVCMRARVSMCPSPRLLITSGVMWRDMDFIRLVNKLYRCYMATVVVIVNGRGRH